MRKLLPVAAAVLLAACAAQPVAPPGQPPPLVRLSPEGYPDLVDDKEPYSLAEAVKNSMDYYAALPPGTKVVFGEDAYTARGLLGSLASFREFLLSGPSGELVRRYVSGHFEVYRAAGEGGTVLFTGYYSPEIKARRQRDAEYRYPLYALPGDLVTAELGLFREALKGEKVAGMVEGGRLVPYHDRKAIDGGGALEGRGLELAWCNDPVEVFFLQVQGSGVAVFEDGKKAHVNYAGQNGRPYRSIGRLLVERGVCAKERMSLDWLRGYLRGHPEEVSGILGYNESYVFFRLEDAGPYGFLGAPVTGGRSIATDQKVYPPGALAYIETEAPAPFKGRSIVGWEPYRGFVLNQDAGGAIKGPGRADIYFGTGAPAERRAGYMRRGGRLYFLAGKR